MLSFYGLAMKIVVASMIAFVLVLLATGCATSQKQNVYSTGAVQQKMKVTLATVIDVREVSIEARPTGAGTSAGVAAGAVVGAGAGGPMNTGGKNSIVSSVAGAVIGGVAGTLAERGLNAKRGQEIVYQIDGTKETQALVQELDDDPVKIGDRVRLMEGSFAARLVKLSKAAAQ